jgi:uncharacterized membrane protein
VVLVGALTAALSLIVAAATFVGTILCYLPGLVVGLFTGYSLCVVMDKGPALVEAIKASVNLVKDNLGTTHTYKHLTGQPVAP